MMFSLFVSILRSSSKPAMNTRRCMDKLITSAVVVKMQTLNLPVALWKLALLFPLLLLLAQPRLVDRQVIASVHWWHDENMKGGRDGGWKKERKKERKRERKKGVRRKEKREGGINWQRYECKFPMNLPPLVLRFVLLLLLLAQGQVVHRQLIASVQIHRKTCM